MLLLNIERSQRTIVELAGGAQQRSQPAEPCALLLCAYGAMFTSMQWGIFRNFIHPDAGNILLKINWMVCFGRTKFYTGQKWGKNWQKWGKIVKNFIAIFAVISVFVS